MLLLDGVPPSRCFSLLARGTGVLRAVGPSLARRIVARAPPELLVVNLAVPWQRRLLSALSPAERPTTLAISAPRAPDAGLADEWVSLKAPPAQLMARVELARARARLRRQSHRRAFVDYLTGLPNRRATVRALVREAERARRRGTALSLVLFDLDAFKEVNDRHGHPAGDRLLRRIGLVLRGVTRRSELCGRIGGDEFALIVAGELPRALRAAQRLTHALNDIGVSCSFAACELLPSEELRGLYRRTDAGLSRVKEERRRRRSGAAPVGHERAEDAPAFE